MKQFLGLPWDSFKEVNDFYMTQRGWRLNHSPRGNVQEFDFPESFQGALARHEVITLGTTLVAKLACYFTRTPGGLRVRVNTCGVLDGCREHRSVSFRFAVPQIHSLRRFLESLERRATTRMPIEAAYCLVFGECGERVSVELEAAATRHETERV
ncbi:hypothetical protein [Amycolatopsis sp. lyj-84]|uniref:hypothetical protein n=1 Tax=Amycolatopsis sp. lyj-84 TaxID=2789284 RepID=UPI00397D8428